MKFVRLFVACSAVALLPAAMAQKWEVGMGAGAGIYIPQDVNLPGSDSASAKFQTNAAFGVWVGQNIGDRWGGELRYSYGLGDAQLKQGSTTATFGAETHTINYSFLLYTKPSESKTRPFLDAGAGIKFYRGTGTEAVTQPLSQYGLLTQAGDLTPVVSVGGGVKVRLGTHAWLRLDVHDYMSTFPKQVITPNFGASVGGWMHDIVPMVAVSFGQ